MLKSQINPHFIDATIDRLVDVFPANEQQQIRVMLADSLRGIVSQQLVRRQNDQGMVVAYEILTGTRSIAILIREGKTHKVPSVIQSSRKQGMRLLDTHLKALVDSGVISAEAAVRVAVDPSAFYCNTTGQSKGALVSS